MKYITVTLVSKPLTRIEAIRLKKSFTFESFYWEELPQCFTIVRKDISPAIGQGKILKRNELRTNI